MGTASQLMRLSSQQGEGGHKTHALILVVFGVLSIFGTIFVSQSELLKERSDEERTKKAEFNKTIHDEESIAQLEMKVQLLENQLQHLNSLQNELPFCFFDNKKGNVFRECPDPNAYKDSCRQKATFELPDGGLPSLQDPEHFIPRLLQFFNHRRVALVGDSLTRQWYETLSCRLGMEPEWYPIKVRVDGHLLPDRLSDTERLHNISFHPMNVSPKKYRKYGKVHGYSRARSNHPNPVDSSCQYLNATLDYYHVNLLEQSAPDPKQVFEFITNSSEVIIFNIGAHYPRATDIETLDEHLQTVMKICGEYNDNAKAEKNSDKQCFYRETLPSHFRFESKPCGEWLPDVENILEEDGRVCGPMKNKTGTLPLNKNVWEYGKKYGVSIVDASMLMDAWKWHEGPDGANCRHYCQDNEVWDLLDEGLLQAAAENGFQP